MPDHKEMGREPAEREREIVFQPHKSPQRQADGDPGKRPRIDHDDVQEKEDAGDENDVAGERGKWKITES